MSRPCPSTRGPKPPVAPKPRLAFELSQCIVGNGDITSSDRLELKQDNESDVTEDETDAFRENCTDDHMESNLSEKNLSDTNHDTTYNEIEEELQMAADDTVGENDGKDDITEVPHSASSSLSEMVDEILDSTDEVHSKSTDDTKPSENREDSYNALEDTSACSENETPTKDQPADECQSPYEEIEEQPSDSFQRANDHYEEDNRTAANFVHHEAEEDQTGLFSKATNCSQPSLCEEYPYDIIGTVDDNSTWQAERATKDPSGRFRFAEETEDAFEPYSVIEVVPSDLTCTSDPEARCSDEEFSNEKPMDSTEGTSKQEPYYVSSEDVEELEEEQAKLENGVLQPVSEGQEMPKNEGANDYADIEDHDGADQQVECVSSEDYVEIGDEDEPVKY